MRPGRWSMMVLLVAACASGGDDDGATGPGAAASTSSSTSSSAVGGGGAGAMGGGGAGNGGIGGASDPCEALGDRASCCADASCSWHENTGHGLYGVPPCVSRDRICEVAGVPTQSCPEGMTCLVQGTGQCTEDDCMLPPMGGVCLAGRGICVPE